jgi:prepilin-type processing-associated H-X9-DG protein
MKTNTRARFSAARRWGFSSLELVILIAVAGLLTTAITPALIQAKSEARQGLCQNRLQQGSLHVQVYVNSQGMRFPFLFYSCRETRAGLKVEAQPKSPDVPELFTEKHRVYLTCPMDLTPRTAPILHHGRTQSIPVSFGYNVDLIAADRRLYELQNPCRKAVWYDGLPTIGEGDALHRSGTFRDAAEYVRQGLLPRHDSKTTVLFADWHTEVVESVEQTMILE